METISPVEALWSILRYLFRESRFLHLWSFAVAKGESSSRQGSTDSADTAAGGKHLMVMDLTTQRAQKVGGAVFLSWRIEGWRGIS